jgi:competence protein ComEC
MSVFSSAEQYRLQRFAEPVETREFIVTGRVSGVPHRELSGDRLVYRFDFDVDTIDRAASHDSADSDPATVAMQKLRLGWYQARSKQADRVFSPRAGESWRLRVRLKPPHGSMNPGGFDYQRWLFLKGIDATGYVREHASNGLIAPAGFWIDRFRQQLSDSFAACASRDAGYADSYALISALTIGDKSSISQQQWQTLTRTGTSHLMAISGMHIGLAALFAMLLVKRTVPAAVMLHVPAQHVAIVAGMLSAFAYAGIAGWSIPTQRAVVMLVVLSLMALLRRNTRPPDALGAALCAVLLFDPSATLSAGFWFSFTAVAVIYISLLSRGDDQRLADKADRVVRIRSVLAGWLHLQLYISLIMLPLTLFMFQQASLVAPLANLILIPYVSLLVVPVLLLALVVVTFSNQLADMLFTVAAWLLDLVWPLLSALSELSYASINNGTITLAETILATVAIVMLLLNGKVFATARMRVVLVCTASLVVTYCLFQDRQPVLDGEFRLAVLDVGQGSAAVIETADHVMIFDTGASYGDKADSGRNIVLPYLYSRGIDSPDMLVISHGDLDHIGGAGSLLRRFPSLQLTGQQLDSLAGLADGGGHCEQGISWQWDGVYFEFLSPPAVPAAASEAGQPDNNDLSCVLKVSSPTGSVLLTGDIERKSEIRLVREYGDSLSADILLVPHHGSNTSSSAAFISRVEPQISIISAGYMNRYHHPHDQVLQRYMAHTRSHRLFRTDRHGAVIVEAGRHGYRVQSWRETARRYWHGALSQDADRQVF